MGGFGHLFYNYWGTPGKYIGWFTGIIYVFFIEQAMLPFLKNVKIKNTLLLLSRFKLVLAF